MSAKFIDEVFDHKGASLHSRLWMPSSETDAIGIILFVHGFSDNLYNFGYPAEFFTSKGYYFFVFDQRGFGRSAVGKERGVTDDFHTFDDLDFFIELLQKKDVCSGDLFLFGHSMGGSTVLNYAIRGKHRKEIAGIVSMSPQIMYTPFDNQNIFKKLLWPIVSLIAPNYQICTAPNTEERIHTGVMFTHDKEIARMVAEATEMAPFIGTLRQMYHMLRRASKLLDYSYVKNIEPDLPILIQHASTDELCSVEGARKFMKHGLKNVRLIEYDGAGHCLQLEIDEFRIPTFNDELWFLKNPEEFIKA